MFMGLQSHRAAGDVSGYINAEQVLAKYSRTPTGRARVEKRDGFHLGMSRNHGVTWVKRHADDSIGFTLYNTEVVRWMPDGSVEVNNWGTVTTSAFAHQFLPGCFHLSHEVTRRGNSGGDTSIGFIGADGERYRCLGKHNLVHFLPDGDGWTPDPDTLHPYEFVEIDRKISRRLSREHHLADFGLWLSMAPCHKRIEHRKVDPYMVSDMLKERDFESAAMHLPLIEDTGAFNNELKPVPIITTERNRFVTMSSIERFRIWLYDQEGAYSPTKEMVVSEKDYCRRKTFINQLANAGGSHLGWA